MKPIFLDTETCGLHGMPVLLQYCIGDYDIELYDLWKNPIRQTLGLLEFIANYEGGIVGFNIAFDWFHAVKIFNVFKLYADSTGGIDHIPEDHIHEIVKYEKQARDGVCLKPVKACDLLLWARKGKFQALMERSDIRIRKVPVQLAAQVAEELKQRIPLNPIFFARRAKQLDNYFQVFSIEDKLTGDYDPNFKDIVLKFASSSGLKALAVECLKIPKEKVLTFASIEVPRSMLPEEFGYAPFADALTGPDRYKAWDWMISGHINHWATNKEARKYATDDIVYTKALYYHPDFGAPALGDIDSELACSVAAVRWKGYAVDCEALQLLRDKAVERTKTAPRSPSKVKALIFPLLTEEQKVATQGSTAKIVLETIAEFKEDCPDCEDDDRACKTCRGKGGIYTTAARAAQSVIQSRKAIKEIEIFDKLLRAGRFHASFKVIGALSGRMAGADGLNPQGIKATYEVRRCFPFKFEGESFTGGDATSFEVVIAAAVYNDPLLYRDLQALSTCSECKGMGNIVNKRTKQTETCPECKGTKQSKKKIHGIFATALYPEETYETVVLSKGTEQDFYRDGKQGVFSQLYGGDKNTLMTRLGISEDDAISASARWIEMYPGIAKAQRRIFDMFCSMRQPKAGGKVYWSDPAECMPSLLGFNRYFTLENQISKALFDLAEDPPKSWLNLKIMVRRRDKDQLVAGAVRSALFGAAFNIQSGAMRAATNHEIQSTGSGIIKEAQAEVWKLQPSGAHPWVVRPANVHDEILVVTDSQETSTNVELAVRGTFEKYKSIVPLLDIDWKSDIDNWAGKG